MNVSKWTVGLAAAGLVSLPAAARAEEKPSPLMTALASTTISGYVNTSAQWNPGTGNANAPAFAFNRGKQDGFNLDVVRLAIEKPLDDAEWAAGYKADLIFGPDASALATASPLASGSSDFAIKQAYVDLKVPIGNGPDIKMGVFDTIIGYEVFDGPNNPNYTRSYGYTIEPTTHTGVLGTYQFTPWLTAAAGVANTFGPTINGRAFTFDSVTGEQMGKAESYKTYMGSILLTAPESFGFLKDSTLSGVIINGFDAGAGAVHTHYYVGASLSTPLQGLRLGASFDSRAVGEQELNGGTTEASWQNAASAYLSFQATEKLTLHGRAEYFWQDKGLVTAPDGDGGEIRVGPYYSSKIFALTGTIQYDLWANVLTRLEVRWDHSADGSEAFGGETVGSPTEKNAVLIAANLIYKF